MIRHSRSFYLIQIELVLLTRLIQKKIETVIDLNDIPKQPWKTKRNATTGFENVYADKSSAYAQYGPCGKQVIRININKALNELRDEYVINDKGMQLITTYCCAHILAKCLSKLAFIQWTKTKKRRRSSPSPPADHRSHSRHEYGSDRQVKIVTETKMTATESETGGMTVKTVLAEATVVGVQVLTAVAVKTVPAEATVVGVQVLTAVTVKTVADEMMVTAADETEAEAVVEVQRVKAKKIELEAVQATKLIH